MDYNQIYIFGQRYTRGEFRVYSHELVDVDSYNLHRGEEDIETPVNFFHVAGKKIYDLINIGSAIVVLLSERVINILKENQITGWKSYPAIIYDKQGNIIDNYSVFAVTGRCGPIDHYKSEEFIKDPYFEGGPYNEMLRGIYPDMEQWDGSDIFTAEGGTAYTFMSKKARDLLVKNKITNITLTKTTEFEYFKQLRDNKYEDDEDIDLSSIFVNWKP
ncbi:hypothetical protein M2138_000970 [Dysgonomonadaceae bacterium PH5-43]|nr:hypothetical protein [Dysgonomonadaceae bacterium PH5-43]